MIKNTKEQISENPELNKSRADSWIVSHLILKNQEALIKFNDFVVQNRDLMFVDFDQSYLSYKKEENDKFGSRY